MASAGLVSRGEPCQAGECVRLEPRCFRGAVDPWRGCGPRLSRSEGGAARPVCARPPLGACVEAPGGFCLPPVSLLTCVEAPSSHHESHCLACVEAPSAHDTHEECQREWGAVGPVCAAASLRVSREHTERRFERHRCALGRVGISDADAARGIHQLRAQRVRLDREVRLCPLCLHRSVRLSPCACDPLCMSHCHTSRRSPCRFPPPTQGRSYTRARVQTHVHARTYIHTHTHTYVVSCQNGRGDKQGVAVMLLRHDPTLAQRGLLRASDGAGCCCNGDVATGGGWGALMCREIVVRLICTGGGLR